MDIVTFNILYILLCIFPHFESDATAFSIGLNLLHLHFKNHWFGALVLGLYVLITWFIFAVQEQWCPEQKAEHLHAIWLVVFNHMHLKETENEYV